ncbi:MAG: SHOCT domain-containing protein [Actinomycetota bacterium]|nr:SHOCT domain-containing protein [Actinomycetota bacterium]
MQTERPHRGWVRFLTILIGILTVLAISSSWVDRQVFDSKEWGDTSLEMLQNPEIQDQIANYAVDELYTHVNVDAELNEILPGDLKSLSGVAAGGLRQVADQGAKKALENDRIQSLWRQANEAAHKTLIDIIEDRSEVLRTSGGEVRLELRPLIIEVASQVGLGKQARDNIPATVGNVDIVDSEELSTVQTVAKLIHGTALITSLLTVLLLALAVWLSPGYRWLTLLWLGITLIVAGAFVLILRSVAGGVIVPELATVDIQPAARAAWDIATDLLRSIAWTVIWCSLFLFALSWLVSPTKPAAKTREFLAVPFGRYPGPTFGLLGLVALVFLLMGAGDQRGFLIRLLIVILLGVGAWLFRRQLMLEYPDANLDGLRGFGDRAAGSFRRAWSGRPKNLPKIFGSGDSPSGEPAGDAAATGGDQATAVLPVETPGGSADATTEIVEPTDVVEPAPATPVPAPAAAPTVETDRLEQLERLGRLRESGVLTEEEFAEEKARIREAGD